ncbi:flavin reductase family protein [Bosea lathyri]|uniref:flavin reductase family protein n=1 Tax=Bosea lathyri TaxID=1036778 RepID=UPI000CDECA7A|nr:flavin reductase family protein [Bosea lathyri]
MSLYTKIEVAGQFRNAMRAHAASVTIITTSIDGQRFGMTATAVTSLTMRPPALTICVNHDASIHRPLLARGLFGVNILRAGDAEFCERFSKLPSADRFSIGSWVDDENGIPILSRSQASVKCRVGPSLEFGSHSIIVGEVLEALVSPDVAPLLYVSGKYRSLHP